MDYPLYFCIFYIAKIILIFFQDDIIIIAKFRKVNTHKNESLLRNIIVNLMGNLMASL